MNEYMTKKIGELNAELKEPISPKKEDKVERPINVSILPPEPNPNQPTLRDQFAMFALNGIFSFFPIVDMANFDKLSLAKFAYDFADAMLEARKPIEIKTPIVPQ